MTDFLINASLLLHIILNTPVLIGFCALIVLVLVAKKQYLPLKVFIGSVVLTAALTWIIKNLFQVERPIDALIGLPDYAFPSGHASIGFALLFFLIYYSKIFNKHPIFQKISLTIFTLFVLIVSLSRLVLHVHTIWQIIAGAILGAYITIWVVKKLDPKYKLL